MAQTGKVVIKVTDMDEDMVQHVLAKAAKAMEMFTTENEMAKYVRESMLKGTDDDGFWHCFVGRKFGAFVTHEKTNFIYFYVGQIAFLLFRSQ